MKISKKIFGILSNGKKAPLYTLKAGDLKLCLSAFGATWTSLLLPAKNGGKDDVLLGFSTLAGYLNNGPYFGVTAGRFANRIGGAAFTLNGQTCRLDRNDGNNSLHGGFRGFDKLLWKSEAYEESEGVFVRFELESPSGDGGYPGSLKAVVSYGLTKSNEIIANYEAHADAPTPVNLTNHAYFNLAGGDAAAFWPTRFACTHRPMLKLTRGIFPPAASFRCGIRLLISESESPYSGICRPYMAALAARTLQTATTTALSWTARQANSVPAPRCLNRHPAE